MEPVQFLRPGVTVFTSALYQTNSVFLETPRACFLVDPCWLPFELHRIRQFVSDRIGSRKLYLIFTHSDYDHIVGWRAFSGAKVIASRAFARNPDKESQVRKAKDFDSQYYINRSYELDYPEVDIEIDKDGKAMHYSGNVLTFYQARGHTSDGLFIIAEPLGVWIAGDYLSDVEPPWIDDDLEEYRRTMAKTKRITRLHQIKWMVPGHGSVAAGQDEIEQRASDSLAYIDALDLKLQGEPANFDQWSSKYAEFGAFDCVHASNLKKLGSR